MCERSESAKAVGDAADALARACLRLCTDDLGRALKGLYDETVAEPVPSHLSAVVQRLSDGGSDERH